jgi:hypothetical protein
MPSRVDVMSIRSSCPYGHWVSEPAPYVVESAEGFLPEALFLDGREQVVVAVRITPVYGQIDLGLLAQVTDAANERGFALSRETPFRDEWLICVFEAFDDD